MSFPSRFLKSFIAAEQAGGIVLLAATLAALFWANSPWADRYAAFWDGGFPLIETGPSLRHSVNNGLMVFFFLLVGCELKRERLEGELASPSQIRLPLFAAMGGMIAPALVYGGIFAFSAPTFKGLHGWAIPTATDIAFALGVLALMRSYVPPSLKAFLLALAIIDDLGAVLLIGLFYSSALNIVALSVAGLLLALLYLLNRQGVHALTAYLLIGVALWAAVLSSGIHATLAGVALAFFIPLRTDEKPSPLKKLETRLHAPVLFGIMPLFALANAGVSLKGLGSEAFAHPVTLGIVTGLVLGKSIGIAGTVWLCLRLGFARRPTKTRTLHLVGLAFLCGIGFTMSLFISSLAFTDPHLVVLSRVGILTGSVLSAVAGTLCLIGAGKVEKN